VTIKKDEGKKPGLTTRLSDGIKKCGKANSTPQIEIWRRTDLYFLLTLPTISCLSCEGNHPLKFMEASANKAALCIFQTRKNVDECEDQKKILGIDFYK